MKNAKISRRSFLLGLAACSAAGILTACKGADTPASSASTTPEAPASSVSELEPIGLFSPEEFPKLDGSTACIPLMAQMMADTTGIDLEVAQSGISVSTTAYAWENFGLYPDEEYTARMLVVYEAPDYVKEELKEANAQLESKPIGRDALVFIVNENNPVKSLTQQQLKDIYAGKITNWKEVGGEDLDIVPFQRGEDSGSQTLFKKLLIQGGELMDPPTELAPAAMGELVDSIAAYNNSANAIGFSVYYYIDQMYSQPGLRLLAVDDVTPSNDTIADESYPLCNEFYAVIHPDAAADSPEHILYDWLDTDAGQDCIKKSGYVAVGPQATVTIVD
jgi:phosphate transport system substrate-binding protein